MHCRDCKFWKPPDTSEYADTVWKDLGTCGAVLPSWDFVEYVGDDCERALTAEGKTKRAFVRDGSEYMATLLCRPDFGCVEFVAKASAEGANVARSEPVPDGTTINRAT